MQMETEKFKLGLFVTISFILICVLFIIFGLFDFVDTKVPTVTQFHESVQGLETGALVKYRGVPIGKVSDITITTSGNLIRVDMEINLSKMRSESIGGVKAKTITVEEFYQHMKREIKRGLRARLEYNGISGFKYIELDYRDPYSPPYKTQERAADGIFYIPSEPSMMTGLRSSVTEVIAKIASIDYKLLSEKVEAVLENTQALISDPHLKRMLQNSEALSDQLTTTVKNLNSSFTPEKLDQLTDKMVQSLEQIKILTGRIDQTVADAKVADTSRAFREAAVAFRGSEKSFKETLAKFNDTMDAMAELIKALDDNPSALISGKKPQESEQK